MSNERFKPTIRRELILRAAIESARQPGGWSLITRQVIANAAGCSEGLVSRYLGDMKDARKHIMRAAIKDEIVEIIAQSIVCHDGYAVKKWLPETLKQKALQSLLG
jgi:AcrR family transcriptional regulator